MINLTPTRKHKLFSDYGISDYYKYYKQHGGTLDKRTYSKVLRDIIIEMRRVVIENNYRYKLPARLGYIGTRRYKNKVFINKKGRQVILYPPDFKTTMEMWELYPELREKKTLIRYENKHTNGYSYKIVYRKKTGCYTNKTIYLMQFNREFKLEFKDFINMHGAVQRDEL